MVQIQKRARRVLGAAVCGIAGSVALLGASTPAQADAADVNWDAVAQCESGGNWRINTGNGYYGGLQFSRSTWRSYGGTKYASTANQASKGEQVAVAEKVLRGQGIGAWPTCGRRGMTRAYRTASVHKRANVRMRLVSNVTRTRKATGHTYVVRPGDTLSGIAHRYHVAGGWKHIYQANRARLSSPNKLYPGQRLAI
ncbi:transglycosylase family protein [Actinoplanes sp. NPDC051851]|uniref:transglycosylase family protein n=1 Tax=Actinoplanes sp. NPDC051851 TaxID=3154753 RepID=UPI0034325AD6